MKANYDFAHGRRGAVVPAPGNKVRITIRLDRDVVAWFKAQVEAAGGGNYQTLLNDALRQYIAQGAEPVGDLLRQVVREELEKYGDLKALRAAKARECNAPATPLEKVRQKLGI